MAARPHPFPAKLTGEDAAEVRRLRRDGAPLAELADRFKIAKSSVSAIVHFHAHVPDGILRIVLPHEERALVQELADDREIPVEDVAAEILLGALRSRAW